MSLESRCQARFPARDRRRGNAYFRDGRVEIEGLHAGEMFATVTGFGGRSYAVVLDWTAAADGTLLVSCECPWFGDSHLCKHVWAAILAADREGFGGSVPGSAPLYVEMMEPATAWEDDEDGDEDGDEEEDWDEGGFAGAPGPRPSPGWPQLGSLHELLSRWRYPAPAPPMPAPGHRSTWRGKLRSVRDALARSGPGSPGELAAAAGKRRQAFYLLDLAESLRSGRVAVELRQREVLKSGAWGKPKALALDASKAKEFEAGDRELLELFLALSEPSAESGYYGPSYHRYGYDSKQRYGVAAALYDHVLPRLCATGRFFCDTREDAPPEDWTPLGWDGGEPWRLRLSLDKAGAGSYMLAGCLERDGEVRPLAQPRALFANGLAVFPDVVARFEAAGLFPWIVELRRDGLQVPESQVEALLEELWKLPALPPVRLPAELGLADERVEPVPCLSVRAAGNVHARDVLAAEVSFDYGGLVVPAGDRQAGIFDAGRRRVVLRDLDAERAAIATLGGLGLEAPPYYERRRRDLQLPAKAFPDVAQRLIEAGWRLEYEREPVRRAGELRLRVESGIDWFDLEGGVEFGEVPVGLPKLLEALRRGERFVELGDGSRGVVPEEWLRDYGALARLGHDAGGPGKVRFLPSQALLLDALLAAAPAVDVDRKFAELRDRLRSFDGIEPAAEPRGFRGELRGYQRDGLGWLGFLREFGFGGCLADDMGLGKTVQVLAMLQARRAAGRRGRRPSLVVAPRSVLDNWADEAARFAPRLEVLVYHGAGRRRLIDGFGDHDLVITTYAVLRLDVALLRQVAFDFAVLDEAQAIKNSSSQVAKASRLLQAEHRLALTGTPVENHLGELWSLFEFLNPGMLGRLPSLQGRAGAKSLDGDSLLAVARALRPFILRRTKEQVLRDLPEKTEQTLYCDLDRKQRKLYDELRDHYRAQLDQRVQQMGLAKSKIQVLEALLRLRQAACHPGLLDKKRVDEGSAKLDLLSEQLGEVLDEGHKVLVFSQFTSLLAILRRTLDRQGTVYEYLDGGTRDRRRRVERFQTDPDCRLFLISLKAGGLGLNLTAADYVYILDPWWNPAVEAQAVDRAHRIGQSRPVFAYRLIARDTVEEKILQLQAGKRELAEAIVSADQSLIRNLTAEDLRRLLS
jgi:superfamily II DNA or RNA helicase